jgi:LemA protein
MIGAILAIVVLGVSYVVVYNNLVTLNQNVSSQWATVQVEYQRRIDLIPNLVNSVKGYQQFEAGLLTNITALRSGYVGANSTADKIKYGTALDSALSRLLVIYENYPNLKSVALVAGLMDELAGTENRIAVERMRYNLAVQDFNTAIHSIPTNLVAGSLGYHDKIYYNSSLGASTVPPVNIAP